MPKSPPPPERSKPDSDADATHRVLGFGALLDPGHVADLCGDGLRAFGGGLLAGWRRSWTLIYRNGCWDEGRYVHADGRPWDGGVAFLDVEPHAASTLPVSILEVDDAALARLDAEEYMYERRDVRDVLTPADPSRPAWLFRGVPEQYPEGRYDGDDVLVTHHYLATVARGEAAVPDVDPAAFAAATVPRPWPDAALVWRSVNRDAADTSPWLGGER